MAESFRLGFEAVKKTQIEAALSVALTQGQILRYVILPQAFSVSIPAVAANVIFLIKETSVVSIIDPRTLISASMSCGGTRSNWSSDIVILSGAVACWTRPGPGSAATNGLWPCGYRTVRRRLTRCRRLRDRRCARTCAHIVDNLCATPIVPVYKE